MSTLTRLDNFKEMCTAAEKSAQKVNDEIIEQYKEQNDLGFGNHDNGYRN